MLPLHDTLQPKRMPVVNWALMISMVVVFILQLNAGAAGEELIMRLGMIPDRLWHPDGDPTALRGAIFTLISSIFLHGGFVHLGGNLAYLAIFGNDVEERFGSLWYLVFFLCCGAFGSVTHALLFPASPIPSIGASGAISGVLGAWFVLHPRGRIVALFPLLVWWITAEVPALLFLPVWFLLQFVNGFLALAAAVNTPQVVGVAWWAHIGGFAFGILGGLVSSAFGSDRESVEDSA